MSTKKPDAIAENFVESFKELDALLDQAWPAAQRIAEARISRRRPTRPQSPRTAAEAPERYGKARK